jgi:glycosyltransferase involved in cell wall biosynthesis
MKPPLVSVIMPMRNAAPFVGAAIRSLLAQTLEDFEVLVVDAASTDGSAEVISAIDDRRIHYRRSELPLNAAAARNSALKEARGDFIAFLDADDLAEPTRLEVQVAALRARPHTGLTASLITTINEAGNPDGLGFVRPRRPEEIPAVLLFENCLALSSITARRTALLPFRAELDCGEDYDLWVRLAHTTKFFIVPQALTCYRRHGHGTSARKAEVMRSSIAAIQAMRLASLEMEPAPIHSLLSDWPLDPTADQLNEVEDWLRRLVDANERLAIYPRRVFRAVAAERWFRTCLDSWQLGWPVWRTFHRSPLSAPTLVQRAHLFRRLAPSVLR